MAICSRWGAPQLEDVSTCIKMFAAKMLHTCPFASSSVLIFAVMFLVNSSIGHFNPFGRDNGAFGACVADVGTDVRGIVVDAASPEKQAE